MLKCFQLLHQRDEAGGVWFERIVAVIDGSQSARHGGEIGAGLRFLYEPSVVLACPTVATQAIAVFTHEQIGGLGVTEVVDHDAVNCGGGLGGELWVHLRVLEKFAVESGGLFPLCCVFRCLSCVEQKLL